MDQKKIKESLRQISYDVREELQKMVCANNDSPKKILRSTPRILFPKYNNTKIKDKTRVSEQEARILFCDILQNSDKYKDWFFSIETPTKNKYQQSGGNPSSARSDLSLYTYKDKEFKQVVNVEIKAHNAAPLQICKDIEKLVKEQKENKNKDHVQHGYWFHILKNSNSNTIEKIREKLKSSFLKCENVLHKSCRKEEKVAYCKNCEKNGKNLRSSKFNITFFICVWKTEEIWYNELKWNGKGSEAEYEKKITTFFSGEGKSLENLSRAGL